jgi:hypothetical protein
MCHTLEKNVKILTGIIQGKQTVSSETDFPEVLYNSVTNSRHFSSFSLQYIIIMCTFHSKFFFILGIQRHRVPGHAASNGVTEKPHIYVQIEITTETAMMMIIMDFSTIHTPVWTNDYHQRGAHAFSILSLDF